MTRTVLITDYDLPGSVAEDELVAAGLHVNRAEETSESSIIEAGEGASGLIVQWAPITARIMDALPDLRVISRLGIGVDMIDIPAATARGIAVANTPSYCIEEVASHSIAMLMTLARGIAGYDRAVRDGSWKATNAAPMAVRPSRTTVGIVGYGRIGSLVAKGCAALGFAVIVADPYVPSERIIADGFRYVTREEAIASADLLSLHVPLTDETYHLLNAGSLERMKLGAAIVNTCRGALIDEIALASAVESGHLSGAALDVFGAEPLSSTSRLREVQGILLSPHAAWYSPESLVDLPLHAAANVIRFLAGEELSSTIVNPDFGSVAGVSARGAR
ncbi:C-terminal binding protein [Diaminobutyricibacter sp. McL0608]|uniref:C-terminal binding protein n=1 Tax=Leifsonia sp. McL0608 TaxID=3143537 RepID=UPI0031F32147